MGESPLFGLVDELTTFCRRSPLMLIIEERTMYNGFEIKVQAMTTMVSAPF
jgi:hypothetical protein